MHHLRHADAKIVRVMIHFYRVYANHSIGYDRFVPRLICHWTDLCHNKNLYTPLNELQSVGTRAERNMHNQ